VRYYNKETGVEGKAYEKKTQMAMCDELGPKVHGHRVFTFSLKSPA
jgi:hypothetical protein